MHIAEGFLPPVWAAAWTLFSAPFVAYGTYRVTTYVRESPERMAMLALAGAFMFVLSALKLPSVTGSTSHPTGTGLAVVLFGPSITAVLSTIVLLYQALLLAHGGITTLGANVASMGIIGPAVSWLGYRAVRGRTSVVTGTFLATVLADWTTYVVTSIQLGMAFPAGSGIGGMLQAAGSFAAVFAITQVPIAVVEGLITAAMIRQLLAVKPAVRSKLEVSE